MTVRPGWNRAHVRRCGHGIAATAAAVFAIGAIASGASAQQSGDGFLFRRAVGQISLSGGFAKARSDSHVFEFTTEQLTLDRSDFNSFEGGVEISGNVSSRFAVTLGVQVSEASHDSEFRDWTDTDDQPIQQTTRFTRVPVMLGLKGYIIPTGQSVGRLAWVPSRIAPFIAGGIGITRYSFVQRGDWVDFEDLSVFTDEFRSSGSALMSYLGAGVDVSVTPRVGITTEVRTSWSRGEHTDDFVGFDAIDLSGTAFSAGFFIRF